VIRLDALAKQIASVATIDGEGGYAVYGTIATAEKARAEQLIPMGLPQHEVAA
jgi:predicted homoserine dehydrogenase-like protein